METFNPPLLCLHGALGSQTQIEAALQPISSDFVLHCPDLPGHGAKQNEPLTMDGCVEFVKEYILKNNLAGCTTLGYSMGGYVALCAVRKYPELFGRIVTLGTKLAWTPEFSAGEIAKLNADIIQEKVPKYAAALATAHGQTWPNVLKSTADLLQDLGENPRLNDDAYQRIMHPIALCLADADNMVTREETEHAARMLPFGEFALIAQSQHPLERTDVRQLLEFM